MGVIWAFLVGLILGSQWQRLKRIYRMFDKKIDKEIDRWGKDDHPPGEQK